MRAEAFPGDGRCLSCERSGVGEPGEFVCLSGGAIYRRAPGTGGPHDRMQGYLALDWHGAHGVGSVGPEADEGHATLSIVHAANRGHFQLYFCSVACFRKFFDDVAASLDRAIADRERPET